MVTLVTVTLVEPIIKIKKPHLLTITGAIQSIFERGYYYTKANNLKRIQNNTHRYNKYNRYGVETYVCKHV